jgi:hypothetical protein|tara:strand:- start:3585 stop:4433 length:849 start_codon:yes stop_codon:yes gene_type:complete
MGTDTLIKDIYDLLENKKVSKDVNIDFLIHEFGESMKKIMKRQLSDWKPDRRTIRLSNVGKTPLQLWHLMKGTESEKMTPSTLLKFMYGHIIEEMLLFLVKASGHKVTDEQKRCEVAGVIGHMDGRIDGTLMDVKSTSSYSFKKFKDGSLVDNDSFGYIDQLKAYAKSEGDTKIAWLAMDKQNGHLTWLEYDLEKTDHPKLKEDIEEKILNLKKVLESDTAPDLCYDSVEDGKSGNQKLSMECSYCQYKKTCWPELRTFLYYNGPKHLIKVVNEPKVPEITR